MRGRVSNERDEKSCKSQFSSHRQMPAAGSFLFSIKIFPECIVSIKQWFFTKNKHLDGLWSNKINKHKCICGYISASHSNKISLQYIFCLDVSPHLLRLRNKAVSLVTLTRRTYCLRSAKELASSFCVNVCIHVRCDFAISYANYCIVPV